MFRLERLLLTQEVPVQQSSIAFSSFTLRRSTEGVLGNLVQISGRFLVAKTYFVRKYNIYQDDFWRWRF